MKWNEYNSFYNLQIKVICALYTNYMHKYNKHTVHIELDMVTATMFGISIGYNGF